jgi:hypothetical protein
MTIAKCNSPKLEWVNHAGFVLDYDGVRLICDPWVDGRAFNDGWELLSDTRFGYGDFASITHIWFSHEHPDHFSPPNIRKIPQDVRARITVLFQQTLDHKVVRFCESLGFAQVVELRPYQWYGLSERLRVLCHPFPDDDSWIALQTAEGTILNINDCVVDTRAKASEIRRLTGPVRVLMTQFSYAQWPGNPDDRAAQVIEAREKLERIEIQASVFKPEYVIPFASFVWFCHDENFALNREMNDVERAASYIETEIGARAIVLYPGETWDVGEAHEWRHAAALYASDMKRHMASGPTVNARPVEWEELERAFADFLQRIRNKNNPLLQFIPMLNTTARLTDLGCTVRLTLHGMNRVSEPDRGADITTTADNLLYCLRFDWGSNTLHANGRFASPRRRGHERFFRFFRIADDNNHGETVTPAWIAGKIMARGNRAFSQAWHRVAR